MKCVLYLDTKSVKVISGNRHDTDLSLKTGQMAEVSSCYTCVYVTDGILVVYIVNFAAALPDHVTAAKNTLQSLTHWHACTHSTVHTAHSYVHSRCWNYSASIALWQYWTFSEFRDWSVWLCSIAFWIPGRRFALIDAQRLLRGRLELAPVRHIEFELTASEFWGVSLVEAGGWASETFYIPAQCWNTLVQ